MAQSINHSLVAAHAARQPLLDPSNCPRRQTGLRNNFAVRNIAVEQSSCLPAMSELSQFCLG